MRKMFMCCVPLFIIISSYAQSENQINDLINRSIERHLAFEDSLVKAGVLRHEHLNRIFFLSENFPIAFEFSKELKSTYNVALFEPNDFDNSELRKGVPTFRILPVVISDNTLSITIINGSIVKEGKKMSISSSESRTYNYQYSCDEQKWEFLETE